jgi:fructokinase
MQPRSNFPQESPAPIDIVGIGELLIDFTPAGFSPAGQALYERNPGGAPANMLAQAARLGLRTQFVGKVGADIHGRFLRNALLSAGVGVAGLVEDADVFTTLAFVDLDPETGERSFAFARKPGADTQLRPDEIDDGLIRRARVLHAGSLSLTDEPSRSATLHAIDVARACGALVSYDPNYRVALWPGTDVATQHMSSILPKADLVKMSLEEAALLFGADVPDAAANAAGAAQKCLACGPCLVAVTLGDQGAYLATRSASARIAAFACKPVDATGAGDMFWGAALAWLLGERKASDRSDIDALSASDLEACGRYACAAASLCVERRGGIPSAASAEDIRQRIARMR